MPLWCQPCHYDTSHVTIIPAMAQWYQPWHHDNRHGTVMPALTLWYQSCCYDTSQATVIPAMPLWCLSLLTLLIYFPSKSFSLVLHLLANCNWVFMSQYSLFSLMVSQCICYPEWSGMVFFRGFQRSVIHPLTTSIPWPAHTSIKHLELWITRNGLLKCVSWSNLPQDSR